MNENLNNSAEEIIQDVTDAVEENPRLKEEPLRHNNVNDNNNNIETQIPKETKKAKNKVLPIILSVIILVLIGILIFVTLYIRNPKVILSQNISKLYNSLLKNEQENPTLKAILNNDKVNVTSNVNVYLDNKNDDYTRVKFLELNYDYTENKQEKRGYLNLESLLTGEEFINLDSLLQDNKIYFSLEDITNGYYFYNYEFTSLLSNKNNDDVKELLNIVKNNIIKNINNSNLTTKKTTIKVDNKDTKVRQISLTITNELINNIIRDSLAEIQNSPKAKDVLKNYLELDDNEINELISNMTKQINEPNKNMPATNQIIYNMYVKGLNKTVKQDIEIQNNVFEYYKYDETKEFNILSNNQNILGIKLIGSNNEGKITGIFSNLSITGDYKKGSINLALAPQGSTSSENGINLSINTDSKEITKNEEYQDNIGIKLETPSSNGEMVEVNIEIINNTKVGNDIPDINVDGAKDINTITEEELEEIMNKILEIPVIKNLIEKSNQTSNYYYNDEDYNYTFEEEYEY